MGRRSFAGYKCEESLSIGLFGECFRAVNKAGKEARVVVVDKRLAARKSFASALARHGTKLSNLAHPHLVTTQTVGRGKDGSLVVIATPVLDPIDLGALIEREGGKLPADIALSIAMGALQGLSHAHEHNVVHGGVHPRSVLISSKGIAKLSDLGLARALAVAAALAEDSELLRGLRGYVAPEIALGNEPDVECDVFAAGALVSQLMYGQASPPDGVEDALAKVIRQAIDTDASKRPPNAGELERALRRVISDGDIAVATSANVADYLKGGLSGRSDSMLDAETEDLLNALGLEANLEDDSPRPSTALEEVLANMGGEFDSVEDESSPGFKAPAEAAPIKPRARTQPPLGDEEVDEDVATQVGTTADYDEDCTAVDTDTETADAVAAMIRATTPVPPPSSPDPETGPRLPEPKEDLFEPRSRKLMEDADDYDVNDDTPLPSPRPFHADGTHVNALVDLVGRQAATSSPFDDEEDLPVEAPPVEAVKRSNTLRLLALIAFVFSILVAVAYTKTDLLSVSKKEGQARHDEAAAKAEKMQPIPGELTVISKTDGAAVWLLLGRTPMKSFVLPSSMIHELRVEHEGYQSVFISVAAQHWSGEDGERKATISVSMLREEAETNSALPAYPPLAKSPLTPGGPGQGALGVTSAPEGAEVWMLVGSTPIMNLVGIEAGKEYSFKVLKDGFLPAGVTFKASDWYLTGTSGPVKPGLVEQLTLEPMPKSSEEGSGLPPKTENGGADEGSTEGETSPKGRKKRRRSKKRR